MSERLKNNLFGYGATVWITEGSNENYKYIYSLNFQWGGTNPDEVIFMYFTQKNAEQGSKIKIYRKGIFKIENGIVKINFTDALYDVWNTFDYPIIKENLAVELDIKTDLEDAGKNYTDKITVKQITGKNIFEDLKEHAPILFTASRMQEEI